MKLNLSGTVLQLFYVRVRSCQNLVGTKKKFEMFPKSDNISGAGGLQWFMHNTRD